MAVCALPRLQSVFNLLHFTSRAAALVHVTHDMYVKHANKQLFINTKQINHKPHIYCSSALQAPYSLCKTKDLITGTIGVTV